MMALVLVGTVPTLSGARKGSQLALWAFLRWITASRRLVDCALDCERRFGCASGLLSMIQTPLEPKAWCTSKRSVLGMQSRRPKS